ncbi:MAG TPA: ABC transporter ATP-binding protein [Candidatus Stackebrandtia excrementipullorum]|nr:ABC transporter ATP-binding protein [Candidatus Stackebrandtia excrementipullorum]
MPTLTFDNVVKNYGDTTVISGFSAEIEDKEFLVLLGPSGCGKSTMLRMIAGLTDITEGRLLFDGEEVNDLEPRERNIAFVFQSYALYPHMTVHDNIAFPLIMDRFKTWHHIPVVNAIARRFIARRPEVAQRVDDVARMLELTDYLHRRPKALSGGQRQRVAVARALVRDPSLYLLDEPLSNLDAKLRAQMRAEISALHQRVGKTFVYVTHDQVEAMTMATRIVVLNEGRVQQIGTPDEIYARPANTFVARFVGSPPMNLLDVTVSGTTAHITDSSLRLNVPGPHGDGPHVLGLRPENLSIARSGEDNVLTGYVATVENLGGETIVGVRWQPPYEGETITDNDAAVVYARLPGTVRFDIGEALRLSVDTAEVSWFEADTGDRIDMDYTTASGGRS